MLTGGVIHAAESGSGAVPDGFVISPEPGAQQSVSTITFCVKGAPGFDILRTGELAGNYITVTSPSGESSDYGIYALPSEDATNGNFYADPVFSEAGEWTVTTHFQRVQYMDQSWTFVNLPEAWQEFTFSYTVSEASEFESRFMEVPEGGVWSESGPGTYLGTFTGYATLDLSEIYSSIELTNPSAQAVVVTTYDQELGTLTTTWQNEEHTKIRVRFTNSDATYGFGTFYVALPTAGKATLLNGETVDLKDMKAGPWIREKSPIVPSLTFTPSGTVDVSAMPAQATVKYANYTGGTTLEVDTDKLDNLSITNPEGVTTQLGMGTYDGNLTITYPLTGDWYTGPGRYTFSYNYAPVQGYTPSMVFECPDEPFTSTFIIVQAGVTPEEPTISIDDTELTAAYYRFKQYTTASVRLNAADPEDVIMYKLTPGTDGYVKYEAPIEIDSECVLEFYAENGKYISGTKSINFWVSPVLRMDDFTISPEPATYGEWDASTIVLTCKNETLSPTRLRNKEVMTITDPSGNEHKVQCTFDTSMRYALAFDVTDIFTENGTYTVDINCDAYTVTVNSTTGYIDPISFTYKLDIETGIGMIGVESSDAVYYDLNGHRVHGNLLPGIYIVHENGKVYKRLIK